MIEFGKTLREAREAKGYSVSQLAEVTHILPQIIENLEKEDFTRIVAPIYGRGFVKLYCEAVGLEPQPLVAEFMEIYNGNRPPVIRLKEVGTPATQPVVESEPPPMPPPVSEPPPAVAEEVPATATPPAEESPAPTFAESALEPPPAPEPPSFDFDPLPKPPPAPEPLSRPVRESEPFKLGPDDLPFPEDSPEPKRDYRLPGHSMPEVPRSFWRFGILIAAAAVILALIIFSCSALYRVTMQAPKDEVRTEERQSADKVELATSAKPSTPNPQPSAPRAPRKPVAVPPLYID